MNASEISLHELSTRDQGERGIAPESRIRLEIATELFLNKHAANFKASGS